MLYLPLLTCTQLSTLVAGALAVALSWPLAPAVRVVYYFKSILQFVHHSTRASTLTTTNKPKNIAAMSLTSSIWADPPPRPNQAVSLSSESRTSLPYVVALS